MAKEAWPVSLTVIVKEVWSWSVNHSEESMACVSVTVKVALSVSLLATEKKKCSAPVSHNKGRGLYLCQ